MEDKTSNNISSTSILKEKIHDISVEEEAEIQKKLSQAKAEIQNLILEGQRLKQANQQLQNDIDSHSTKRLVQRNLFKLNIFILHNISQNKYIFLIALKLRISASLLTMV